MDTNRVAEIAKKVWKDVFKQDANIEILDGEVMIDQYISIAPGKVDVRRVSLLGEEVTEEDGYVVSVWKMVPGGYMEPDDVDEIHIGESTSAYDAVQLAAEAVLQDICNNIFECMSYAEYDREQKEYAESMK